VNAGNAVDDIIRGIAIVILTWNELDETRRCLQSLQAAGYSLGRVVLWDNGSSDGTEVSITREFPSVIYHHYRTNLGVASGRNAAASLAIQALSPSHLMFLDNDMVVTHGCLEALSEPFASEPKLAQALAKIRFLNEPERLQSAGGQVLNFALGTKRTIGFGEVDLGQYDQRQPCLTSGGATLVSADVFRELDGFDSIFDPFGDEDTDFAFRVRAAGYQAMYVPEAVVYHDYCRKDEKSAQPYIAARVRQWMILLSRHATLPEKLAFFAGGALLGLLKVVLRELVKGNIASIRGILVGLREYVTRESRIKATTRLDCQDTGAESD
jgi:GT2 family glycosyltransferase